jgi:hypothetical protein
MYESCNDVVRYKVSYYQRLSKSLGNEYWAENSEHWARYLSDPEVQALFTELDKVFAKGVDPSDFADPALGNLGKSVSGYLVLLDTGTFVGFSIAGEGSKKNLILVGAIAGSVAALAWWLRPAGS